MKYGLYVEVIACSIRGDISRAHRASFSIFRPFSHQSHCSKHSHIFWSYQLSIHVFLVSMTGIQHSFSVEEQVVTATMASVHFRATKSGINRWHEYKFWHSRVWQGLGRLNHWKLMSMSVDIATSGGHEQGVRCNTKSTHLNFSQLQLGEAFTHMRRTP